MFQRSQVSGVALCMSKVKVLWLTQWVTEWVSEWQGHLLSCSGQLKTVSTDISGNIHRKCPIFSFLTSIHQTGWLPKQFIIVRSPSHLVLIPGGFYYWRDARSTMVHRCQRADFKESSKLARGPNRNGASQPYETFCTLTRHPNTPLGPKKAQKAHTGTPSKKVLFQKMRWKCMKMRSFNLAMLKDIVEDCAGKILRPQLTF